MKNLKILILLFIIVLTGCKTGNHADLGDGVFADMQTSKGEIIVKLEHEATPVTVANFVSLAEGTSPFVADEYKGKKYYDGIIFHRVMENFMIQCGDPTGTGGGSPGYKFDNEIVDSLVHNRGVISMANAGGTNTNGSQFFITHVDYPNLNGGYSVFGKVVKGMDVVDSIATTETKVEGRLKNKPVKDIILKSVEIIRNGRDAKKFDAVQVMTDYFDGVAKREEEAKKIREEKIAAASEAAMKLVKEFESQKGQAKELPSGLKVFYINQANGQKPATGQNVLVNYAGYFTDGRLFDSNIKEIEELHNKYNAVKEQRGGYFPVPMTYSPEANLIPGFREGLQQLKVGDKARVFVPSHLGYGSAGAGGVIPPNADLVFDLEITEIKK
ncbi:peptidylprolyl isomerase [Leptobacterium flavescens]|uniref:peptidylprolyl isomerase n=1 Tax=Leptobacterium flavescens TaxID=472055 RepID=A0A6P0UM77_9FLAO|nr:peptidylprolyl isomerase [Leptobacterium flavescens]NER12153.1 peptidylprolyl isomerase [Leptobacterium flavescens]